MVLRLLAIGTSTLMRALGARPFRVETDRVSLLVHELGPKDGEPWVLLHGMGSTGLSWAFVTGRLRRNCRLLVPELSALGGTGGSRPGLDVREGVQAVAQMIRERVPDRPVTVAGISLGGWIATRLALAEPALVERLLLVNCAGYRDQDWERIQQVVTVSDLRGVDRLMAALFYRTPLPLRLARRGFLATYNSPTVRHILDSLTEEDSFDAGDLARLELPVGLIWGDRDGLFYPEVAHAMRSALPNARLEVVPRCGHGIQWERPRALAEAIDRFRSQSAGD